MTLYLVVTSGYNCRWSGHTQQAPSVIQFPLEWTHTTGTIIVFMRTTWLKSYLSSYNNNCYKPNSLTCLPAASTYPSCCQLSPRTRQAVNSPRTRHAVKSPRTRHAVNSTRTLHAVNSPRTRHAVNSPRTRHAVKSCLLYTSPSPRDLFISRMPSSA